MNISRFGRASLAVRNLEASARFYSDVLQLPILSRCESTASVELGIGKADHFALTASTAGSGSGGDRPGLNHIAFVIGNNPGAIKDAAAHLTAHGVTFRRIEHDEYESLLLQDPDGHLIELYYWPEW